MNHPIHDLTDEEYFDMFRASANDFYECIDGLEYRSSALGLRCVEFLSNFKRERYGDATRVTETSQLVH